MIAHLTAIGLKPSDIHYLVCTHLDDDHSGNHDLFTGAELVIQRRHYELAKSGHSRFLVNRSTWDHPLLRYRLIEGDIELVASVELLETSGHVPGHQSVLVHLPKTGGILLAADAVMHRSMATAAMRPMLITDMDDEPAVRRSTQKVSDIAKRGGVAFVVYGHDAQQWKSLRTARRFMNVLLATLPRRPVGMPAQNPDFDLRSKVGISFASRIGIS